MVIEYMTKYVAKSEFSTTKSAAKLMGKLFISSVEQDGRSVQSFLRSSMNKVLGDCMISKQESCHLMLSLPIVYCTHKQVNVDLKNTNRAVAVPERNTASVANRTTNGETASTENVVIMTRIDAYAVRSDARMWKLPSDYQEADLESITLQQFCLMYKVSQHGQSKNKICKDTVKYVINFFPSPSSDQRNSERYTEYCKYALMKHRPWAGCVDNAWGGSDATSSDIKKSWNDFLATFDPTDSSRLIPDTLRRAYDLHQRASKTRGQGNDHEDAINANEEGSYFSGDALPGASEDDACQDQPDMMQLLQDRMMDDIDVADIEWDQGHDWSPSRELFDVDALLLKLEQFKSRPSVHRNRRNIQYEQLNERQRIAHNMVIHACTPIIVNEEEEGLTRDDTRNIGKLQILLGAGGTGKSYVIDSVITKLKEQHNWTENDYSIYATTGKAATNVNGSTFQNFTDGLGLFGDKYSPLGERTLQRFQNRMKDKKLIIVDEFSMMKQCELHFIDLRLKQIMCNSLPFGGLVVLLCGDPAQLPPVKGNCLWGTAKSGSANWNGLMVFQMFNTVMKLIENRRLDENDPQAVRYNEFLTRNRDGANNEDDWKYIVEQCSEHSMSSERRREFEGDDVVHLYTTNREVQERNLCCLQNLNSPIVKVEAQHTRDGRTASSNIAGGLEREAYYCKGANILLTKNVWQTAGLCNGATGKIIDIVYHDDDSPPPSLPKCVIVDFDMDYTGPAFFPKSNPESPQERCPKRGWVPIFPERSEWQTVKKDEVVTHSRTMLPLRLCYAWTIWKAQGQTLRCKVVADLCDREKEHGLSYTVFSRITKPQDLMIKGGVTCARLCLKIRSNNKMEPRMREERRLDRLVQRTLVDMRTIIDDNL